MEEIDAPGPAVVTLDVDEQYTYAQTSVETLRVIRFFLEELKPVNTEDIETEDGNCAICAEQFTTDSHRAVRLPCNHIFGKSCIEHWLRPYASLTIMPGDQSMEPALSLGANSCPQCRRVFFPKQGAIDSLPNLETRVKFWDMAYAHVGITLSENERRAREDLLRYLGSYPGRGLDVYYPYLDTGSQWQSSLGWHQHQLFIFSFGLRTQSLTPEQENLRQRLEDNARLNFPGGVRWWRNDQDELFFAVGRENEERDEREESEEVTETEHEGEVFAEDDTEEM
ncbi:hypothetical protein MMC29_003080 [Sticta canariensis]|nr:hypothetical protein [Sticta canariensis]